MTSPPPRRTVQPPCEESPASPPARSAVGGRAEAKPAAAGLGALGAFRETKPVPAPAKQPTRLSRYSRRQLTPRTRAAAHRPQKASRRSPKPRPPHPVERSHRPPVLDSVIEHVAQEKPATGRRRRRFRRLHRPRGEKSPEGPAAGPSNRLPSSSSPSGCRRPPTRRPLTSGEPHLPLEPLCRRRPRSVEATFDERDLEAVRVSWQT